MQGLDASRTSRCDDNARGLRSVAASHEVLSRCGRVYSWILARISASLNRWYSYRNSSVSSWNTMKIICRRTSSPILIELPPQPGSRTLSPALTETGITAPSLFGAPGPTAMTVASGSGEEVAEVGRKMPVAVFWSRNVCQHMYSRLIGIATGFTHCVSLEALDQDTVEERDDGANGLDGGLERHS